VELLFEFTDWWGDGETAIGPEEAQLEAVELTAKKDASDRALCKGA